jgi:hypothetical protein
MPIASKAGPTAHQINLSGFCFSACTPKRHQGRAASSCSRRHPREEQNSEPSRPLHRHEGPALQSDRTRSSTERWMPAMAAIRIPCCPAPGWRRSSRERQGREDNQRRIILRHQPSFPMRFGRPERWRRSTRGREVRASRIERERAPQNNCPSRPRITRLQSTHKAQWTTWCLPPL